MELKELARSSDVNERTFGEFVRQKRELLGISVRSFASMLGCSAAYLSDIEKGNRYAPRKYLDAIFKALQLSEEDRQDFEDLAAATRGFTYEDINPYLGKTPTARIALRTAIEGNYSDDYWKKVQAFMEETKNEQ